MVQIFFLIYAHFSETRPGCKQEPDVPAVPASALFTITQTLLL